MVTYSITKARADLYNLVEEVNETRAPYLITNSRGKNAVLVSEDDWNALQETLAIYSVPGLVEEILEEAKEPPTEGKLYDPNEEW